MKLHFPDKTHVSFVQEQDCMALCSPGKQVILIWQIHSAKRRAAHGSKRDVFPACPRKTAATLDEAAFLATLKREGDALAARAVWLGWQGGLTVKEMLSLTWKDVAPPQKNWTV